MWRLATRGVRLSVNKKPLRAALSSMPAVAPRPTYSQPQATSTASTRGRFNIFGGSEAQRENVARRLSQLPEWHSKLKFESIAICLLTDGLFHESTRMEASIYNDQSVGRATSSASTASSGPLAEAFLKSDLLGTILTIFHVDAHEKQLLHKAHGTDVIRSWAKDTLRQHLASMGSVGATGLICEPVLMDLSEHDSDAAHEDDAVLAKALTHKVSLKTTALPGTLIPAKHANKLVLLVFPRRETRPSEVLHRVERLLLDYCRKNLICLQTYYLALDRAYSPDVAVRQAESQRYQKVVAGLPKGSLVLGEEVALDVLIDWTEQARRPEPLPPPSAGSGDEETNHQHVPAPLDVDISTFYMSLINFFYGPPSDVLAGSHCLENLGPHDVILVTDDGHHPYDEGQYHTIGSRGNDGRISSSSSSSGRGSMSSTSRGMAVMGGPSVQAALRGEKLAGKLGKLMEERFGVGRAPQIECGDLEKVNLDAYTLVVIHSGNHPIEPTTYKKRLDLCKQAGVAVSTPSQIKTWLRRPSSLATVLKVWPRSFKARVLGEGEEEGGGEGEKEKEKSKARQGVVGVPKNGGSSGKGGGGGSMGGGDGKAMVRTVKLAMSTNGAATPADGQWDHGYRKTASHVCSECNSWSCGQCTRKQQEYGELLGKQHQHGMGMEWRDLY